jgi:hypothetical protein
MIELVLIACLIGEPERCERIIVPLEPEVGLAQCLHTSQIRLVEWVQQHPEWQVRRWTCQLPEA